MRLFEALEPVLNGLEQVGFGRVRVPGGGGAPVHMWDDGGAALRAQPKLLVGDVADDRDLAVPDAEEVQVVEDEGNNPRPANCSKNDGAEAKESKHGAREANSPSPTFVLSPDT